MALSPTRLSVQLFCGLTTCLHLIRVLLASALLTFSGCSGPPRVVEVDNRGRYTVSAPDALGGSATDRAFVVGSVVGRDGGFVVPGAVVRTVEGGHRATADSLGRFRLALPPGVHAIEASYLGFVPLTTDPLDIGPRTIQEVRFELGTYAL